MTESPLCGHKGGLRARDPAGDQPQAQSLASMLSGGLWG